VPLVPLRGSLQSRSSPDPYIRSSVGEGGEEEARQTNNYDGLKFSRLRAIIENRVPRVPDLIGEVELNESVSQFSVFAAGRNGTGRGGGWGGEGTERERGPSSSRFLNFVPVRPYESNWNRKAIITPS
jgi:hypothetical protein